MKKCDITKELFDILSKYKVKCKCGHVLTMVNRTYGICTWCGKKVYRSKKDEFEDKLKNIVKNN